MFIRELKNRSGSVSIQIISKVRGRYKVVKTIGCATEQHKIDRLKLQARQQMEELQRQPSLFASADDQLVEQAFSTLSNSHIRTVGPELIFGKIYDYIGFGAIGEPLFRHWVVARLAFPLSKLKTSEYLYRYQGVWIDTDKIYRFLDKLNNRLKEQVEQIAFAHTKRTLQEDISVVFYDMTTLYCEASDEDDLRKTGFSKDGKHSNPQIVIGLLVGLSGYPKALEDEGYEYIIGARLKNESKTIQQQIIGHKYQDGDFYCIDKKVVIEKKKRTRRLIIHYSDARARKDAHNRKRGLERLEKRLKSGRLTKSNINNRGYNKYLEMKGEVTISIDYRKYESDSIWDGLKGYITNSKLPGKMILENYAQLWHIEKAFRISKTDLRIRPIFHRLKHRIEAHSCIAFAAYSVYKELERVLQKATSSLSPQKANEVTHNMYQITYSLPDSKHIQTKLLKMDEQQAELYKIIEENF